MKTFAERLKELRQEKGFSFETLSKETGLSRSSLCRWENCQSTVNGEQLIVLAKYFNVTTDWLLGLE